MKTEEIDIKEYKICNRWRNKGIKRKRLIIVWNLNLQQEVDVTEQEADRQRDGAANEDCDLF